jgi:23S rRNA (uracil1939-C5)-methyltransferase
LDSDAAMEEPAAQAEQVDVKVHGLAVGGSAVGRVTGPEGSALVGMTAFVPFAAPGETVRAAVLQRHARHLEGELVTVLEPSPDRVTPRCPFFGPCGGCDTQHLAYDAQLAAKLDMVRGAFKAGGLGDDVRERIAPAVVAGPPYDYRRRVTLHVGAGGALGYYRRHTRDLLPVTTCPIAVPEIQRLLESGFSFAGLLDDLGTDPANTADLSVERAENGLFGVLRLRRLRGGTSAAGALAERMKAAFAGGSVEVNGRPAARFGEGEMLRRAEGAALAESGDTEEGPARAAPGVFSQVNAAVNERLVARIREIARGSGGTRAYDLYAGMGNFSFPLAAEDMETVAVEVVPALVAAGRAEAERRGLTARVTFLESTVEQFVKKLSLRPKPVDLIVADPPRAGLGKLAPLVHFGRHLVLVSCHLPSAVRDIKNLQGAGWTVEAVEPYDMFAQTTNVELLTHLSRRDV